ncbi:MAG: acetylneuraminic acid synthetase, partial [Actinobacteria bacterium]|nr:acetylneuraminic acid synthetase [Actinomycetota bacterium]
IAKNVRKSLVWSRNLSKSHQIKENDISIKRPGTGLPPEKYWDLIGRKIKKSVIKDKLIKITEIL